MVGVKVTAEMAKGYFENMRRYMCEEHLKLCPRGTVAYYATIKEKELYDMAIKALEENEQIKAQINRWFQKATDKMKAENDHDEQLLYYAERLQDECKDLKDRNDDLNKCIELHMEASSKCHEKIQKVREEIERQRKWLFKAGYNAYNIDVAFDAIKSLLKGEQE